jgi:hypothetical protein
MYGFWKLLAASDVTAAGMVPEWVFTAAAAVVIIACAIAALRGGSQVRRAVAVSIAVVVIAAVAAGWLLDHITARDLAEEQRAMDERAFELKMRALAPGSALACLDPIAGEFVQDSCERALFASPEATAAAVSYVTAQLSLLATGSKHARASGLRYSDPLTALRRTVEADRFGIVGYLFAMHAGCGPTKCDLFDLLQDSSRVRANLAARRFESYVKTHTTDWPPAGSTRSTAGNPASASSAAAPAAAAAKPPSKLFFPSASSIPPVNIMTSEPVAGQQPHEASASADPAARSRRQPQGLPPPRLPPSVDSGQARSTPLQIAPPAQ